MRFLAVGTGCLFLALNACEPEPLEVEEACDFTLLVEADGLGKAFAAPVLHAIEESARIADRPMSVKFLRGDDSLVFAMRNEDYDRSSSLIRIDSQHLSIGTFQIEVNGKPVTDLEFRELAQKYGDALEKTDSRGVWRVSANTTVSISRVLDHLAVIHDRGVTVIDLDGASH